MFLSTHARPHVSINNRDYIPLAKQHISYQNIRYGLFTIFIYELRIKIKYKHGYGNASDR